MNTSTPPFVPPTDPNQDLSSMSFLERLRAMGSQGRLGALGGLYSTGADLFAPQPKKAKTIASVGDQPVKQVKAGSVADIDSTPSSQIFGMESGYPEAVKQAKDLQNRKTIAELLRSLGSNVG